MPAWKVYRVNEALIPGAGAYTLVETTDDPDDSARRLAQGSALEHLRSFVRFEAHGPNGERRELARGLSR